MVSSNPSAPASKRTLIIAAVVLMLIAAAAAWFFSARPKTGEVADGAKSASGVAVANSVANPVKFDTETKVRQELVEVALGRVPADLIIRGATVLNVYTGQWDETQDIVIKGERIAWVGPAGEWQGKVARIFDAKGLWAVPGFGETHKHIESSMVSPEWEAALAIPFGNTWTSEASHEFSNVNGEHNVEFWNTPERFGSPLKIFTTLGSATPPSSFEVGGGDYIYKSIADAMQGSQNVVGLDEVMDWPAVSEPKHPGYQRIWEIMQATRDNRGLIDGHGSGLTQPAQINAFAAAGLSSDHETRIPEEAWTKLQRGVFLQLRDTVTEIALPFFVKKGLKEWSNTSLTTDDLNVADSLRTGTMNRHVRTAIELGVPPVAAYQMATINPARHAMKDAIVGSISPGRYADVVLLTSVNDVAIKQVFAHGKLAAQDGKYLLPVPKIDWPAWATDTINIGRKLTAADFEIRAPEGRTTVTAAIQSPFYREPKQVSAVLPVVDGVVQRDPARDIIKVAIVDRYTGEAKLGKMFWTGIGPKTPNSAVASSVSHDLHNIVVVGTSDEAMAMAVNRIAEMKGGIVLVDQGKVTGEMRLEIGGLMTSRPIAEAAANLEAMWSKADTMEWIGEPGFPKRVIFSMITCSPNTWRLVVPYPGNPGGLVLLQTGQTMPTIW
jgi:adenine deaminase